VRSVSVHKWFPTQFTKFKCLFGKLRIRSRRIAEQKIYRQSHIGRMDDSDETNETHDDDEQEEQNNNSRM
jgi:hypothetical protein